jgi:hypothetical protein
MITKNTTIIASQQNLGLLEIFLDANNLSEVTLGTHRVVLSDEPHQHDEMGNIRSENYYNAINLNYDSDHADIVLSNLAMIHSGLNNMLIDYLIKVGANPMILPSLPRRSASPVEITENFHTKIKPKLKDDLKRKYPNVPVDAIIT